MKKHLAGGPCNMNPNQLNLKKEEKKASNLGKGKFKSFKGRVARHPKAFTN